MHLRSQYHRLAQKDFGVGRRANDLVKGVQRWRGPHPTKWAKNAPKPAQTMPRPSRETKSIIDNPLLRVGAAKNLATAFQCRFTIQSRLARLRSSPNEPKHHQG